MLPLTAQVVKKRLEAISCKASNETLSSADLL